MLLLHTCNLSSCVQPCTVFCTSLKLCVPSNRICESRGVFSESRTACLHTELRTCWMTDMGNGSSSPSQQQPVATAKHLTLWYRHNIYTSFLPWNLCAYIYICIYCVGLSTLHSPVVTIFTIRFDVKQCYPLSWAVRVRSAVVGSQNSTAKGRVCRHWNGVTLRVLDFIKTYKIKFGCHSKERNGNKRKSGSSVVEYSSSLVNVLARVRHLVG